MLGDEARYLNTHFRLATWALTHVGNCVILFIYFEHVLCESKSAWWHDKASATLCLFTNSIWFDNITNRSVEFYRNSSLRFLCFLLIKRLLFDLDPRSLILIPFHGGRLCNMGCIYFPKTSPHTSPLFPIREMELGIYSTTEEGVGISSIGASSPSLFFPENIFTCQGARHAEEEEDQDWRITIHDFFYEFNFDKFNAAKK